MEEKYTIKLHHVFFKTYAHPDHNQSSVSQSTFNNCQTLNAFLLSRKKIKESMRHDVACDFLSHVWLYMFCLQFSKLYV